MLDARDDEPDQDKRIEKLRSELEKLDGGVSQHPELSADLEEAFLKHILAFETAEPTTLPSGWRTLVWRCRLLISLMMGS